MSEWASERNCTAERNVNVPSIFRSYRSARHAGRNSRLRLRLCLADRVTLEFSCVSLTTESRVLTKGEQLYEGSLSVVKDVVIHKIFDSLTKFFCGKILQVSSSEISHFYCEFLRFTQLSLLSNWHLDHLGFFKFLGNFPKISRRKGLSKIFQIFTISSFLRNRQIVKLFANVFYLKFLVSEILLCEPWISSLSLKFSKTRARKIVILFVIKFPKLEGPGGHRS